MAVKQCRTRCWKKDWVLDLDVQQFFDSVDHDLMVKAVGANTDQRWVVLYVKRWLTAPMQMPDGSMVERDRGTPQGGLCAAAHKPPNEQCWFMRSVDLSGLVSGGSMVVRCA